MDHQLKQRQSPAIKLEGIEVTLPSRAGPVAVLRGIDLGVTAGDAIAVVGPSGSGKSTLLMVIAGLERATSGSVEVMGTDYASLDEDGLALLRAANIGIVFQSFHLVPTMTALENVAVPLELAGRADAFPLAKTVLGQVGLGERLSHYPAQLSGGEQQRVAIARALAIDPAILIADEPTGNLDGETGGEIADLLFAAVAERGTTLVLVTHDTELAARCDRTVRIAAGQIEAGATPLRKTAARS